MLVEELPKCGGGGGSITLSPHACCCHCPSSQLGLSNYQKDFLLIKRAFPTGSNLFSDEWTSEYRCCVNLIGLVIRFVCGPKFNKGIPSFTRKPSVWKFVELLISLNRLICKGRLGHANVASIKKIT